MSALLARQRQITDLIDQDAIAPDPRVEHLGKPVLAQRRGHREH